MAMLNVNRGVMDPFYRYKMPRLIAKVEGKGNGIKTVIVNMVDVAKALSRPPTYTTKFFGCELGAQTQMDLKNDRFIVNGSHEANRLQDMLDGFIKKFVLCPECDNPETVLQVQHNKQTISQRCQACGYMGMIDMRHKLTAYILKNPPELDPFTVQNQSVTPGKKKGKGKKHQNGEDDGENGSPQPDDANMANNNHGGDEVGDMGGDTGGGGGKASSAGSAEAEADDDWGEEISPTAVKERMEELTGGARSMTLHNDLERTQTVRLDLFYEFLKRQKEQWAAGSLTAAQAKKVLAEADRLDVREKAALLLVETLLDAGMLAQIKRFRPLFLLFCHGSPKAQKYLLGGFEQVVQKYKDLLLPKVPHLLKSFYDLDILDEEVLQDWGKKVSKKYVSKEFAQEIHERASPFIKWLNEAEEDSESDGAADSEDELEVDFTVSAAPGTTLVIKVADGPAAAASGGAKKPDQKPEEDLDIDAI